MKLLCKKSLVSGAALCVGFSSVISMCHSASDHNWADSWQKPTKWHVRPAKTQISLGVRPVWSESSLSAWTKLGSLATHWASTQCPRTDGRGRMPRLIWVFAGRTVIFVGFVMRRLNWRYTWRLSKWTTNINVSYIYCVGNCIKSMSYLYLLYRFAFLFVENLQFFRIFQQYIF